MAAPKILVVTGNGFNCERETAYAFDMNGGNSDIYNMNYIIEGDIKLSGYQILAFVGGFSYGDHLGGGKVAAVKFRNNLKVELMEFVARDTLIIGICNGFQVLMQLGILPALNGEYFSVKLTLAPNNSKRYEDRWVQLKVNQSSNCIFTQKMDRIMLPVRHGEGKLFTPDIETFEKLLFNNQTALQYIDPENGDITEKYPYNPNGSFRGIAGICDPSGRIFGLMPHPEAYLSPYNNPDWTRLKYKNSVPEEGDGVQIFRNAVEYFQ